MDRWTPHARRVVTLALLFLIPAVLASAGLRPAAPVTALAILSGVAAEDLDEPNGLIAAHAGRPEATPAPPLVLAEVSAKKAPLPSGPVTYVPILYYHYIRINPNPRDRVGFSLSTPPAMFSAQMQYLANHGFHVISLHQAVVAINNHSGLPSRPVVLTFDDGYADFFTVAVPILQSHGFTATSFVISGRMGSAGYMTPDQVTLADAMGFTIGAHTVDHVALAAQVAARATWEMKQSKLTLEYLLGHPVVDFAYPYGSFNQYDMAQAKTLGFETAVSTTYGTVHSAGQLFALSRMRIGGSPPLSYFAGVVGGPPPTPAELRGVGAPPATSPTPSATAPPSPTPAPTPSPSPSATATASALSRPLSLSL
jgi:peptidoglycan/xylan/chitin deacetylase (PgdA/CDA1 family)